MSPVSFWGVLLPTFLYIFAEKTDTKTIVRFGNGNVKVLKYKLENKKKTCQKSLPCQQDPNPSVI